MLTPIELELLLFGEKLDINNLQGKLIHIYGEAGTGKTTLAMQLACGFCLGGKKVVVIDSEGKVTGSKIKGILQQNDLKTLNDFLILYQPESFQKQHELIRNLEFFLLNQEIGLIVIDTITNLYRQETDYTRNDKDSFKKLAYQVALLQKIAHENNFPILLVNQATMPKVDKNEDGLESLKRERVFPVARSIVSYWAEREVILISHGFGNFEARIPREHEGRVKFGIDTKGIIPSE